MGAVPVAPVPVARFKKRPWGSRQATLEAMEDLELPGMFEPVDSPLLARSVNMPTKPMSVPCDSDPSERLADQLVHCLILPLDVGWFPSPLFLALAVQEPTQISSSNLTSPSLHESTRRSHVSSSSRGEVEGIRSPPRPGWFRNLKEWWKSDVMGSRDTVAKEGWVEAVERELLQLALAASGRGLRNFGQGFETLGAQGAHGSSMVS
eukprot:CAMPEP_0115141280 /NCGR_PEP_ID=MMETSP0227-20121206/59446_1 /TAXON_ID=89957 /ORGANISM="Polarella glacialis, Strain CCMP 1383" /LENGTH=206 /DNA_ID=CAMNT_0002549617 /DNA_START=26 /DNA_END=646 /DNA_ORIENTATION=-